MTKHKHKFQLLGYAKETLSSTRGSWISSQIREDKSKALFVCECGQSKEVKIK